MEDGNGQYRAFLLRCWCDDSSGNEPASAQTTARTMPRWHFVITEVMHQQHRHGFADLEALITFLQKELIGELIDSAYDPNTQPEPTPEPDVNTASQISDESDESQKHEEQTDIT